MDSSPPQPIGPGQRLLAAIVFTDVVSFSARMQAEEVATLELLERDFAVMRKTCEKYSGSVLKTTGDGLLLYFTSAVNAVSYAQKMQRSFAERARTDPADESLTHRVGIHLGDVFVNNDDVMGDGVNIAARLQSQAEPGGICISQTVYDVVKNKLELDVVKLEPRELKNISESITMYRVVLEAPKPRVSRLRPAASPLLKPAAPEPMVTRRQKLAIVVALVLALALAAGMIYEAYRKNQEDLAQSRAAQAQLGALVKEKGAAADAPPLAAAQPAEFNFAELLRAQKAGQRGTPAENAAAREKAKESMQILFAWLDTGLQRYTQDKPLLVHPLVGRATTELEVFTDAKHRLSFAEGPAIRPRNWADLKPEVQGAIAVSALLDSPAPPPHEVEQGADAFAYFYGLPEVAEALNRRGK
jgi:class 3 adenylate cyclase